MKDLSCPACSQPFKVDTEKDSRVRCPNCGAFLRVVTMLDGAVKLSQGVPTLSGEATLDSPLPKKPDTPSVWRPFVVQKNRPCAECGEAIKKYQSGYGLIEDNKIIKIVCMKCDSKRMPSDEENPLNKFAPNIIKRPSK